jgi:hypothetical protein
MSGSDPLAHPSQPPLPQTSQPPSHIAVHRAKRVRVAVLEVLIPPAQAPIHVRHDRLRHSLAGSPGHTDRIEFTATTRLGGLCYGLVVLVPWLATPPLGDAVSVRYRTALHRTEADFHRSIPSPAQAHERSRPGCSNVLTAAAHEKNQAVSRLNIAAPEDGRTPRF